MAVTEKDLSELEQFFKGAKLPKEIQLEAGTNITDVSKFIDSHLAVLRNNGNKPAYQSFHQRLLTLKAKLVD